MARPSHILAALAALTTSAAAQLDNVLTSQEQAAGWKLLFDGTTAPGLRGLQNPDFFKAGWTILNGALVLPKTVKQSGEVTGGDLVTAEQFSDFEFSFEFKFTASAHTGILYFARGGPNKKPTGHEYQIIDDVHHPDGLKGGPLRRTGALYGVLAPSEDKKLNVSDSWNSGAIVVRGNRVEHWLNGKKVLEYECESPQFAAAVRESKAKVPPTFGKKIKSSLVILDKGEEVAFRNLKIRAISAAAATPVPPPKPPAAATPSPAPAGATPAPRPGATPKPGRALPPPPPPPDLKP
jgi:hypothetical protein